MWRAGLQRTMLPFFAMGIAVIAIQSEVIAASQQIDQPATAVNAVSVSGPGAAASSDSIGAFEVSIAAAAVASIGLFLITGWYRLTDAARGSSALRPAFDLAMFIGFFVLGHIGVSISASVFGIDPSAAASTGSSVADQVRLVLGQYIGQALLVVTYVVIRSKLPHETDRRRSGVVKAALTGVVALIMTWPVVLTSASLAAMLGGQPLQSIAHETLRELVNSPRDGWFAALSVLVVFVGPALEEFGYRFLLQRSLAHMGLGPWPAIVLTSMMFALMHARVVQAPALAGLFVLSLALGWAFQKTGRLTASITMHALFNAANLAAALMVSNPGA